MHRQHYTPRNDPARPTEAWEALLCFAALFAIVLIVYLGV